MAPDRESSEPRAPQPKTTATGGGAGALYVSCKPWSAACGGGSDRQRLMSSGNGGLGAGTAGVAFRSEGTLNIVRDKTNKEIKYI